MPKRKRGAEEIQEKIEIPNPFPLPIWNLILSNISDFDTLTSIAATCKSLNRISKKARTKRVAVKIFSTFVAWNFHQYPVLINSKGESLELSHSFTLNHLIDVYSKKEVIAEEICLECATESIEDFLLEDSKTVIHPTEELIIKRDGWEPSLYWAVIQKLKNFGVQALIELAISIKENTPLYKEMLFEEDCGSLNFRDYAIRTAENSGLFLGHLLKIL